MWWFGMVYFNLEILHPVQMQWKKIEFLISKWKDLVLYNIKKLR